MRVLVFDRTDPRLSIAWRSGAQLYRGLRRIDAAHGVASWAEGLDAVLAHEQPIDELQYWGHGKWGCALVAREDVLAERDLIIGPLHARLEALRERLAPDALIWFRTCETFGAKRGLDFAQRLADWTGARVAGHTHVIGFHQSGLHGLRPGHAPDWSPDEAIVAGSAEAPERAAGSRPWRTRTITCLRGDVPDDWFA